MIVEDGGHHLEFMNINDIIKDKYWCKDESGGESVHSYILKEINPKKNQSWLVGVKKIYNYNQTYFKEIYDLLSEKYKLGRMRLLTIRQMTSLSKRRRTVTGIYKFILLPNSGAPNYRG